jgi:hypothetical protein
MYRKRLSSFSLMMVATCSFAKDVADSVALELTSKVTGKQGVIAEQFMVAAANPIAVAHEHELDHQCSKRPHRINYYVSIIH